MSARQPRPVGLDAIADPVADADVAVREREVVAGVCRLRLDVPSMFLAARAGQFALVRSLRPEAPLLPRPLSIVSLDDGLELVFNIVGPGTKVHRERCGGRGRADRRPARPSDRLARR